MSRPWMPLYVADYLEATQGLSTIEHGAYLLLIMSYWSKGSLPDDDKRLARIAGLSDKEWKAARPALVEFFKPGWKHSRVEEELAKTASLSEKRKANAGKRWSNRNAIASANDDANGIHHGCVPPSPSPSPQETAVAVSLPAAAEIDLIEVERCLKQASGGWELRRADVILELALAGYDLDDRILPLVREEAARRRKIGKPPPDTWAYFKPMIEDAERKTAPAHKPASVEMLTIHRDSPDWERAAAAYLAANGKPPPCPDGHWYFPKHMVEATH